MVTATTWVRDPASLAFVICEVKDPINVAAPTTRPVWHYLALEARRLNWLKLFSGAVGMGPWGLSWWYLRVPLIPLGGWDTDDTSHLPPKCPWQNLSQQPRKPGHQTAGGGRGPGVRAAPPPAPARRPLAPRPVPSRLV